MNNVDIGRYSRKLTQYLWDREPVNDDTTAPPIWCLGVQYAAQDSNREETNSAAAASSSAPTISAPSVSTVTSDSPKSDSASLVHASTNTSFENVSGADAPQEPTGHDQNGWPTGFLDDFESRIWLTYRSNFPLIPKSEDPKAAGAMTLQVRLKSQLSMHGGFTSDQGWGCMIRSGQCLLANALAMLRLGRDWRRSSSNSEEKRLLQLFADDPEAPFSLHNFVSHGAAACGTYPGQWFGPSATAKCIEALSNGYEATGLRVYVTGDGSEVFEDLLFKTAKAESEEFRPTLLLVGTRLGIDRVTPAYWSSLKSAIMMPQSVGIAGGRPAASHYFVGVQGTSLFYLDPHHTRPALPYHPNPEDYTTEEVDSCHTRRLRRIPLEEMDPSMLVAFLFRDESDWRDWRRQLAEQGGRQIVHVVDSHQERYGLGIERDGAVDEVEPLDDEVEGIFTNEA